MLLQRGKPQKGFTLIELMVVVAILAILAAVAIPAYMRIKTRAEVEGIIRASDGVINGLQAYHFENGGFNDLTANPAVDPNNGTIAGTSVQFPFHEEVIWAVEVGGIDRICLMWCNGPPWDPCGKRFLIYQNDHYYDAVWVNAGNSLNLNSSDALFQNLNIDTNNITIFTP